MNIIIEKIRAEIERLKKEHQQPTFRGDEYEEGGVNGYQLALNKLLSVLSDLEKSEKPKKGLHSGSLRKVDNSMKWMEDDAKELTLAEGDVFKEWGTTEKEYLDKSMEKVRLEMEIATYLKDWEEDEEIGLHLSTDNGCIPIELDDVRDLARHFAKWGAEHAKIDVTDFCKPIDPGIAQCITEHFWEMLGEDEKSVPNDLEEAAMNYIAPIENEDGLKVINFSGQDIKDAFIAGAKWQAEQDKETIELAEDHAYLAGAVNEREKLMKEAVPFYEILEAVPPGPERENVRIIIVKEDEK